MKLELKFFLKDEKGKPYPFPDRPTYTWEDGPKEDEITGCSFPETTLVSAFFSETGNDKYRLQLAFQPDFSYSKIGNNKEFYTEKRKVNSAGQCIKDENGKDIWERDNCVNLFQGAMGSSVLRLSQRNLDHEWEDIFSVRIAITPSKDKLELMRKMAVSLFPINPFLVLSNVEGLSKVNVVRSWEQGDSKEYEWNAYIELETVKWMYRRLFPRLYAITYDCAYQVAVRHEMAKIHQLRRIDGRCRRKIENLVLRYNGEPIGNRRIMASSRCCDVNIVAHRAIGSFLWRQLKRLLYISRFLDEKIREKYRFIEQEIDGNKKKSYRGAIQEEESMKLSIDKFVRKIQHVISIGPWARADSGESIFKATPKDFSFNENYGYVYSLIGAFEKMRFMWRNAIGEMLTPSVRLVDSSGGESRWQRNYSYVYESWVFVSLLKAFKACGFPMLNQYRTKIIRRSIDSFMGQRNNDPVPCASEDGELMVELFHGVCAPKWDANSVENKGLSHHADHGDPITPDFEIRFIKKGFDDDHDSEYVIVLDAKSGRVLGNESIQQRNKYIQKLYRNQDQDPPHQVWLVYSGTSSSGVEFNDLDGKECWAGSETMIEESPGQHNGKFRWTLDGITDGRKYKRNKPFVGHLRCNAETIVGKNVFEEFVRVQLKTVRRYFGLKAVS